MYAMLCGEATRGIVSDPIYRRASGLPIWGNVGFPRTPDPAFSSKVAVFVDDVHVGFAVRECFHAREVFGLSSMSRR